MKLLFSGYILPRGLDLDGTRSASIWKSKTRQAEVSVLLIEYRNTVEKKRILDLVDQFEENSPHTDD